MLASFFSRNSIPPARKKCDPDEIMKMHSDENIKIALLFYAIVISFLRPTGVVIYMITKLVKIKLIFRKSLFNFEILHQ